MKYYVVCTSNGYFQTDKITEWSDFDSAKNKYHAICNTLGTNKDVETAIIKILDSQLDVVGDYSEFIDHRKEAPAS